MITKQIKLLTSLIKRVTLIVTVIALFLFFVEILRAFQTLHSVTPFLGWAFIVILGIIVLYLINSFTSVLRKVPKKIKFPKNATNAKVLQYYLKISNRLLSNQSIPRDKRNALNEILVSIKNNQENEKTNILIDKLKSQIVGISLNELDDQAEVIVRNTVRDTMVSVTLSPYRSVDGIFVIYRNIVMFNQLMRLYNQRPAISDVVSYFKDVIKLVAGVNVLGYSEKLMGQLLKNVPLLNRTSDDIIQGIGAGILTTSVGKATIQRCRCIDNWDKDEEKEIFNSTVKAFYGYVKEILSNDVMPNIRKPFSQTWEKMKSSIQRSN